MMRKRELRIGGEERAPRMTRWMTLGRACDLVGVNESTLRRWADAGMVRSFRTPGGHRRFAEDDLREMTEGRSYEPAVPAVPAFDLFADQAVARIKRRLQRARGGEALWSQSMSEEGRDRVLSLAGRLVSLVGEYVAGRSGRGRVADDAVELGREFGKLIAEANLTLKEGIGAFSFIRRSLDDLVLELIRGGSLAANEVVDMWEAIATMNEEALTAIPEGYGDARPQLVGVGTR